MDKAAGISCGQIVSSKSGRDKGRLFVVIDIVNNEYVLLADGDLRKIEKPKKKNIKHVNKQNTILTQIAEKIANHEKIENIDLKRAVETLEIKRLQQESEES